jgi:hypothetical protein
MNAYQLKMGKGPWAGTATLFHVKRPDVTPIDVKELGVMGVGKPPRRTFRHGPTCVAQRDGHARGRSYRESACIA